MKFGKGTPVTGAYNFECRTEPKRLLSVASWYLTRTCKQCKQHSTQFHKPELWTCILCNKWARLAWLNGLVKPRTGTSTRRVHWSLSLCRLHAFKHAHFALKHEQKHFPRAMDGSCLRLYHARCTSRLLLKERRRGTVCTVRFRTVFQTWRAAGWEFLQAFTSSASFFLELCKGREALHCTAQKSAQASVDQRLDATARASRMLSLVCRLVGKHAATWCARSLPSWMMCNLSFRVDWCNDRIDFIQLFSSACKASLDDVPLGSRALARASMACRIRAPLKSHSMRSGAAAAHNTFRTSLAVPVTFLSTSVGCNFTIAASTSMKVTRQYKGFEGSRFWITRFARNSPMEASIIWFRSRSSWRDKLGAECPWKKGPKDARLRSLSTWLILFTSWRKILDPEVRLPHWAYS